MLFILAGLFILAFALVFSLLADIQLGTHAVARHNSEAFLAREIIGNHGGPGNRWNCPDGRVRIVVRTVSRWAVMVLEGNVEVTAFMTDSQDYVTRILEGCDNPQHYSNGHP
jgi:hypothetical protein